MATKRLKELRNMSQSELVTKIQDTEKQLFGVRMEQATGQLKDTALIWRLRKDVARMKMLQSQPSSEVEGSLKKAVR